jgi:lipoprotein
VESLKNKVKEMRRVSFRVIGVIVSCLITSLLCGCNLFVTDKDRFYLDKDLDYMLTWIDLEKTGSDIIIPSKVGNKTVKKISLKDPYFSGIDSLDVSHVDDLESFKLVLYAEKNKSKLKKLDFSKNKKLRDIVIGQTKALKNIKFNKMLFSMRNKLSTTTSTTQVRFYTN